MNLSGLTSRQRLILLSMIVAIMGVFAMLTGFIVTSVHQGNNPSPNPTPSVSIPLFPSSPPTPAPSPSPAPTSGGDIWSQVQAARIFDQIAHQVETTRDLAPRAEVPLSFLDPREMTLFLRRHHLARDPQAYLLPYTSLGLLPAGPITIQTHQVTGIYIPEQQQIYIVTGQQADSPDDQALLAHAYVHALQDQHFNLGAMDARATTTDAQLAIESLIEGDALLLTALYRTGDLAEADWPHLTDLIVTAEKPGYGQLLDQNGVWANLERFPYWEGRRFVEKLFQENGWTAINRAYVSPPRSTEQVLHPERYATEEQTPLRVVVPDPGPVLGDEWTPILEDTLGEFVIGLYLSTTLPAQTAWETADGWDGDTYVLWERDDGAQAHIWRTVWSNTQEAQEFERALVTLVPQRYYPTAPLPSPEGLPGNWWETSSGAVFVSRVARYVTLVNAPSINVLTDLVASLP